MILNGSAMPAPAPRIRHQLRGEARLSQTRRESQVLRLVTSMRLLFTALGLAGLIFGYLGLDRYVHTETADDPSVSNLIYYDFELILLQSTPLAASKPEPAELQIARFCAPCVLVYPVTEFTVALSAARIARSRRRRGHAVVCGSTRAAQVLASRLRAAGTRVVVVSTEAADESDRDTVTGDPRSPHTLRAAGVPGAHRVYACFGHGEQNAEIAAAVEQVRSPGGLPERIHVLIPDLELCSTLRARHWSVPDTGVRRLGFFNPEESAAQATVRADEAAFAGRAPYIAIVGVGAFARSILVEFARQWLVRGGAHRDPVTALLIDADARAVATDLVGRYAFLADACRIEPHAEPFEAVLERHATDPSAPTLRRLYFCQEDEGAALKAALDTAAGYQSAFTEAVVRLDRMTGIAAGFRAGPDGGAVLFDALGGRLRLVDITAEGCDPDLIEDDLSESLARACHQRYLSDQFASGEAPRSSPALVPWEELEDGYRAANRDQASGIGRKLAEIGCILSTRRASGPYFEFRDGEIERLAELEHERWKSERLRQGWTWGAIRDEGVKLHPSLVPWWRLPEPQREKDRQVVRGLPEMLADAGLAIVRMESGDDEQDGTRRGSPAPGLSPGASPLPARSP